MADSGNVGADVRRRHQGHGQQGFRRFRFVSV